MMGIVTVYQPWASLIASGDKAIESRPKMTAHRGDVAIHAGMKRFPGVFIDSIYAHAGIHRPKEPHPHGSVLCVVDLYDVVPSLQVAEDVLTPPKELALGNYLPGRFGWMLRNVRVLKEPLPLRGQQGLRRITWPEVEAEIRRRCA